MKLNKIKNKTKESFQDFLRKDKIWLKNVFRTFRASKSLSVPKTLWHSSSSWENKRVHDWPLLAMCMLKLSGMFFTFVLSCCVCSSLLSISLCISIFSFSSSATLLCSFNSRDTSPAVCAGSCDKHEHLSKPEEHLHMEDIWRNIDLLPQVHLFALPNWPLYPVSWPLTPWGQRRGHSPIGCCCNRSLLGYDQAWRDPV